MAAIGTGTATTRHLDVHRALALMPAWCWTLGCGLFKIALGAASIAIPLMEHQPLVSSVGWLLLLGGLAELALGWGNHKSFLGMVTIGSGALTVLAGILFIGSGWAGLFPLTTIVMFWLFLRGLTSLYLGIRSQSDTEPGSNWLVIRGTVDFALGMTLLLSLPITAMVVVAFGATQEAVTTFSGLLAISFLVGGVSLVAIGLKQRRRAALPREA